MKEIVLTKGFKARVDDDNYDWLSEYKWHAQERYDESDRKRLRNNVIARTAMKIEPSTKKYPYKIVTMHRLIMNAKPGQAIDHINGDTLDNRKENLRFVTNQQNAWNARGAKSVNGKPTSSKYKGVYKQVCKTESGNYEYFVARIGLDGKDIQLYHGKDEIAAAHCYDAAARKYYGEYAKLNFNSQSSVAS